MPYNIGVDADGKFCVYNKQTGKNMGCSGTREEAVDHMRALYANEGKELDEVEQLVETATKDLEQKMFYASEVGTYGATTYAELADMREAQEREMEVHDAVAEFPGLVHNILYDDSIGDKSGAVGKLAGELGTMISNDKAITDTKKVEGILSRSQKEADMEDENFMTRVMDVVKAIFPFLFEEQKIEQNVLVWKEADGSWRWLTRYSNNFRDRDVPPEIISAGSHRRFVELVDKGLAPYPELWLWHVNQWKVGQSDWVSYDEVSDKAGFALAGGYFLPGCEQVADWLSNQKDFRVSHGMPVSTIQREDDDDTVIVEHETREISFLPADVAANLMTDFITIKKEADMAIPKDKRDALTNDWGLKPELLDQIEALNASDAEKATEEGIESKEAETTEEANTDAQDDNTREEDQTEEVTAKEETEDKSEVESEDVSTDDEPSPYPTREEVADAVITVLQPYFDKVNEIATQVDGYDKALKGVQSTQQKRVEEAVQNSSMASLQAMILGRASEAKETEIEEDDELADKSPKETEATEGPIIGIPFIDEMRAQKPS